MKCTIPTLSLRILNSARRKAIKLCDYEVMELWLTIKALQQQRDEWSLCATP